MKFCFAIASPALEYDLFSVCGGALATLNFAYVDDLALASLGEAFIFLDLD